MSANGELYVTTPEAEAAAATVKMASAWTTTPTPEATVTVKNEIFELGANGHKGKSIAALADGHVTSRGAPIGARPKTK